jgi:CubicO group peptidase (beta-lactamase class C family)
LANVETNSPATPETVDKTASLSKQVIAAAILLLVRDGKISLDDKANKYLDDAPDGFGR